MQRNVHRVWWVAAIVTLAACGSSTPRSSSDSAAASTTGAPTTTVDVVQAVTAARPYAVTVEHPRFVDTSRPTGKPGDAWYAPSRTLPTDVYLPTTDAPRPLVVLAHGYHGAPEKFTQLLGTWARAGYVVAAPRFPLTANTGPSADVPTDYVHQPDDLSFVIDRMLDPAGPYARHVDATRIGAAGLSMGGGTLYGLLYRDCCRDDRVRAGAIFDGFRFGFDEPFAENHVPMLIVHGDHDPALPYDAARTSYEQSRRPVWFVTLLGALHAEAFENTPSRHDATVEAFTTDWWDLQLLGDRSAAARMEADATAPGIAEIASR